MLAYRKENNKIVELLEFYNEEQLEQFPNFVATDREIIQNLQGEFVFKDTLTEQEIEQINNAFLPIVENDTPSLEQRINDIELALMELAEVM